MKRSVMVLMMVAVAAGCAGSIYPIKTDDIEYHVVPQLEATEVFKESDSARYGPIRILRLQEAGKPDFALDIHPRAYGLEPVDSTANYVFKVRVRHVMQGSRPAEAYEIRSIARNGQKIYP
jgi:hypothetical protein